MSQPLLALTSGELQRLAACLRALPEPPGDAALSQHQIASDRLELRAALVSWLQDWNRLGGSNASLALTITLLLTQRQGQSGGTAELVWSGPHGGAGDVTRDQAVLIREMVERCEQRLLLTTFNIWRGGFITELLERIQQRLKVSPGLQARMVVNIPRPKGSSVVPDQLRQAFVEKTWSQLWDPRRPRPRGYFDPRSLDLGRERPRRVPREMLRRRRGVTRHQRESQRKRSVRQLRARTSLPQRRDFTRDEPCSGRVESL